MALSIETDRRICTFIVKDKVSVEWLAKRFGVSKIEIQQACIRATKLTSTKLRGMNYEKDYFERFPKKWESSVT